MIMMQNRQVVSIHKKGSYNYNLNTPESDEDFVAFLLPNYDDLYNGTKPHFDSKSSVSETYDISSHDIRRLPELLWKCNVNFTEALFSIESTIEHDAMFKIMNMRNEIARMNLPYLASSCVGMYYTNLKEFKNKGNFKKAMGAYRIIDFMLRFAETDFTDFKHAIWYDNNDPTRQLLLDMKAGLFVSEGVEALLEDMRKKGNDIDDLYHKQKPNLQTKELLDNIVYDMVEQHIKKQLGGNVDVRMCNQ